MRHELPDLVDEDGACRILGGEAHPIHRSTLWRGVREGRYPKPIKISGALVRWKAIELIAVIERAAAAREGEPRG